jgi:hypothetical protein
MKGETRRARSARRKFKNENQKAGNAENAGRHGDTLNRFAANFAVFRFAFFSVSSVTSVFL